MGRKSSRDGVWAWCLTKRKGSMGSCPDSHYGSQLLKTRLYFQITELGQEIHYAYLTDECVNRSVNERVKN